MHQRLSLPFRVRTLRALAVALALFGLALPALAVAPQSMRFERLTIDDGLSQSNVKSVVQDQAGFIWFATESGLNRYDGYSFRQYHQDRQADDSLASDFIGELALAPSGDIWVATDGGGLARWHAASDTFSRLRHQPEDPDSIADDHVRALLLDPRGWLWIGLRHDGLDRLDLASGEIKHFRHDPANNKSLSSDEIYDLALGPDGAVWVGTQEGLNRLVPGSGNVLRFGADPSNPAALGHAVVHSVMFDRSGTLWVGTTGGGLHRLDAAGGGFENYRHDPDDPNSLSDNNVQALFEDTAGRLWVGTAAGLNLLERETGRFVVYRHDPTDVTSLSSDNIVSLFEDRSGLLWVGTKVAGVNRWNPRSWAFGHVEARPGVPGALSNRHVTSFTQTPDGRLWVGTFGGGLNVIDPDRGDVTQIKHDPGEPGSLSADRVMALLTDAAGYVWIGTMGGGLNRLDPHSGAVTVLRHDPDDPGTIGADGIMSLYEDRAGRIWVGTFGGGVSVIDPETGEITNHRVGPGGLTAGRATAIIEDARGTVWVGTDGGGLNAYERDSATWRAFEHDSRVPSSLSSNTVYSLHVDAYGRLWIGTRAGFNRLVRAGGRPVGFAVHTRTDGLPDDSIYGIRSDRMGKLWLSTNYGLVRFDPEDGSVRSFHYSHGLQGEEFNFGAHYANARGELMFGGSNGFNIFDPASITLRSEPPTVVMTAFSKLNVPVPIGMPYDRVDSIRLGYDDDVVTFEFAALDFVAPAKNRYSYFLEGFDKDWIDAGTQRRFTFTNLDAGSYVLRVRAANSDGAWSEEAASIPVHVAAPPWKSWWAYLLYAAVAGFAVYSYLRAQRRKLEREAEYSRRLEAEVQARTAELAERNSQLEVANGRLHEASHTDALTGLRNRRYLFDEIAKELLAPRAETVDGRRRGSDGDVIFIVVDLDHFKPVNDNLGHLAGDQMLLQVRDVLLKACRASDTVIRWGGDEFLVVARGATRADATALVERIRACIAGEEFVFDHGATTRTSCSIGFAAFPFSDTAPEALDWQQVLYVADTAMYRAKQVRNAWCGIYCGEWGGTAEELLAGLKDDAIALAESGSVLIVESSTHRQQEIA